MLHAEKESWWGYAVLGGWWLLGLRSSGSKFGGTSVFTTGFLLVVG